MAGDAFTKVICPKYYKNANESYKFLCLDRLGCDEITYKGFFIHVSMCKIKTQLELLYIAM